WLTYEQMADLYGTTSENIIQIVRRVLADREVDESTANSELVVRRSTGGLTAGAPQGEAVQPRHGRLVTSMAQWTEATDRLLEANQYALLTGAGSVSHQTITELVDTRWPPFAQARRERDLPESLEIEADDLTYLWDAQREIEKRKNT
ncbi:MAG: hypothetical protein FWD11_11275, partial [Micrococcales bacterium]|nr:hypothetical protein [Micrococcales bacterium]